MPKARSKKYQRKASLVDKKKKYPLNEAITEVKKLNYAKYDSSLEAHFNLDLDPSEEGQNIRTTVDLPHGSGKSVDILVFSTEEVKDADLVGGEDLVEKINAGKVDALKYSVILSTPELMAKVASLGKILGPQGLMPNPKSGTVVKDPAKAVAAFKKGKVPLKTELSAPIIHTTFGKVSFKDDKLVENFKAILTAIYENKPKKADPNFIKSIFITTSQSPSVEIELSSL